MKTRSMNSGLALFLQGVIVLVGMATLALLLWEPHFEGRNAHATTFQIYFNDPFLAYVYMGSIPFFVALYQAFALLGQVRQTGTFSSATVGRLRVIKRCALSLIGFVAGAAVFIILYGDGEDRPAGFMMCMLAALMAAGIATAAACFGRSLQRALD
jgi:hypothetical protein